MRKVKAVKPKKEKKDDRLGVRLSPDQKVMIERKAQARGLSASSFLLTLAIAAPEKPG